MWKWTLNLRVEETIDNVIKKLNCILNLMKGDKVEATSGVEAERPQLACARCIPYAVHLSSPWSLPQDTDLEENL